MEPSSLMTEACSGYSFGTSWVGPRHGEWGYGYATGHDMLWQLRNRASGWVYWNLLLDERGGLPTQLSQRGREFRGFA